MKRKKKTIIMTFLLILIVVVSIVTWRMGRKQSTFANPHQFGQMALYGEENNDFCFQEPKSKFSEVSVSQSLASKINFPKDLNQYDELQTFIVGHKSKNGSLLQHIQIQYFSKTGDFLVISAYEVMEGIDYGFINVSEDIFGNKVQHYSEDDYKVVSVELTQEKSLTSSYYIYNEESKEVNLLMTLANEMFTYKDHVLYHVMYTNQYEEIVVLDILNEFIN